MKYLGNNDLDYIYDIGISLISSSQNRVYHRQNYLAFLSELDANLDAIYQTHKYLASEFPSGFSNEYVGFVFAHCRSHFGIDLPEYDSSKTLDDILDAFDTKIDASRGISGNIPSGYKNPGTGRIIDSPCDLRYCCDEIALALDFHNGYSASAAEPSACRRFFMPERLNIYDATCMMTCVACYLHPEHIEQYPVMKHVDLSPEAIFGEPFRESRREMLSRVMKTYEERGRARAKSLGTLCQLPTVSFSSHLPKS